MSGTYKIDCDCTNCGARFDADIKKGTPFKDGQTCTNCGCATGRRHQEKEKVHVSTPYPQLPRRFNEPTLLLPRIKVQSDPRYAPKIWSTKLDCVSARPFN